MARASWNTASTYPCRPFEGATVRQRRPRPQSVHKHRGWTRRPQCKAVHRSVSAGQGSRRPTGTDFGHRDDGFLSTRRRERPDGPLRRGIDRRRSDSETQCWPLSSSHAGGPPDAESPTRYTLAYRCHGEAAMLQVMLRQQIGQIPPGARRRPAQVVGRDGRDDIDGCEHGMSLLGHPAGDTGSDSESMRQVWTAHLSDESGVSTNDELIAGSRQADIQAIS